MKTFIDPKTKNRGMPPAFSVPGFSFSLLFFLILFDGTLDDFQFVDTTVDG